MLNTVKAFALSFPLAILLVPGLARSAEDCRLNSEAQYPIGEIEIEPRPIFDVSAEDSIALHQWANSLHIITKPFVVSERLPFEQGDVVSIQDIVEAEALLREQRYLANAEITPSLNCENNSLDLQVTTYDNWSFIPTLSFSRSGGENSVLVGVREDNLLGLGIRATARYSDDEQRSGYQFSLSSAVPGLRHADISLRLADNDDGEVYSIVFNQPFYHLSTETSLFAAATLVEQTEDIYQNSGVRNSFDTDREDLTAAYGWKLSSSEQATQRLMLGITKSRADFVIAEDSPSSQTGLLPQNRDFVYPWLNYQYVQRNIMVLEDIYLINQPEDINLGWHFSARLGLELNNDHGGTGFHASLYGNKGYKWDNSLLMLSANLASITNTDITDFVRLDAGLEYFYRDNSPFGYYASFSSTFSSGQFLDQPIVVDDDNGVRGFPLQYQHGDNRITTSAEARWYTDYNIYQLFEVGFATFVDIGRAYGGDQARLNQDDGWLSSIGIGARFYSNKASNSGVIHLDIAKPFSDDNNVDSLEWSLQFRSAF